METIYLIALSVIVGLILGIILILTLPTGLKSL